MTRRTNRAAIERAQVVVANAEELVDSISDALVSTREIIETLKDDFPHNDDPFKDIVGALHLIQGRALTELSAWRGYLHAREN